MGIGLEKKSISLKAKEIAQKCKRLYLENYTADLPYTKIELEEVIGKKLIIADRELVEGLTLVDDAKKMDVGLLVYGSPLIATTHITLIQEAKNLNIKYKVIHNSSVFDAVAETGLQIYKFGKTTSMPEWKENYNPKSFIETIKQNQSIDAHTLILIDIGLDFPKALEQLTNSAKNNLKIDKLILCQSLGTKHSKIFYKKINEFKEFTSVRKPYCIIIPGKLHFVEKEFLENL